MRNLTLDVDWHDLHATLDKPASVGDEALPRPIRGRTGSGKTVCFTSVTRRYLPKAFIFASSLKSFHPDIEYHILINDSWHDSLNTVTSDVDVFVSVTDLIIDNRHGWIFGMDAEELCCAVRPFYFMELLKAGYEKIIFFDPDIVIFGSLDPLLSELDTHPLLLTPHTDSPAQSDAEIFFTEMSVLAHGVFNLGFLAARNCPDATKVIAMWRHRLYRYSLREHERGLWTDQKWFNLVPVYFPFAKVLRHKGCNVASWNIISRPISKRGSKLFAGEDPLIFFHFSGFDSGVPERMYRVFRQFNVVLREMFERYTTLNREMESKFSVSKIPWVFESFDSGEPIPMSVRRFYRSTLDNRLIYREPFYTDALPSFHRSVKDRGIEWIEDEYDPPGRLRKHF